jgi:hypothetical protein
MRSLETRGVRIIVGLLLGLGILAGSVVSFYFPSESLIAIPVGLAIAVGAAVISWRPYAYAVLCWAALLLITCVYLLQEFARAQAPTGVLLVLFVAGFCAAGAGFLELAVLRRGPRTAATDA